MWRKTIKHALIKHGFFDQLGRRRGPICIINIYINKHSESASRFSRGKVLNMLKQSGINILRGKKDATTFKM